MIHVPLRLLRILGRHANIIEFHGVYETADHAFYAIAMELMPEGELLDVIGHIMGANYTERDVLVMFRQVVEAVDHCHRNNVVHCDIKV
jgi:serine/threonine protein kinase